MRVVRYPWKLDVFGDIGHEEVEVIPDSPWYVMWTCTAFTYSGWTPGYTNRVVMLADELGIANEVASALRWVGEATFITVTQKRPRNRRGRLYVVMTADDAPGLYPAAA